jgi:alanyl-tRNA synthetase
VSSVAERLYYDSPALEFTARVADIRLDSKDASGQLWQVALDRTAFYPEGGGQPWDTGVLTATAKSGAVLEVSVERVEEDEVGEVWHFVRKPLIEGTEIVGRVDAARRIDHMQQHTGQHLLSAVFLRELNAPTVSFHLGADSVTIDLGGISALSDEEFARVEAAANHEIFLNHTMRPKWITREEAEAMLASGVLRKLAERSGPIRIVEMETIEYNACGGTHVASTGAIGSILIRRTEKVKQGLRVEFCCGQRAVRAARADFQRMAAVANSLSVGAADVQARVAALLEEARNSAKERKALLEDLAQVEAAQLVASVPVGAVAQRVFEGRDIDFAKRVAAKSAQLGRAAAIGAVSATGGAVAIARWAGSSVHCGNLLQEALAEIGARGGGAAELAQGLCSPEALPALLARLAQALEG